MKIKSSWTISAVLLFLLIWMARIYAFNTANAKVITLRFNDYQSILGDFGSVYYSSCYTPQGPSHLPKSEIQDPNTGEVLYSWRFANFLNCPVPYQSQRSSKWTSVGLSRLRNQMPIPYSPVSSGVGSKETSVFAVTGPGSAFDESTVMDVQHMPADLVLFADVYDSNTHWMQPGDFNSSTIPNEIRVERGIGSKDYSGFFLAFADGEIWYLKDETPISKVTEFFTTAGASGNDRESVLGEYCISKQHSDLYRSFVHITR